MKPVSNFKFDLLHFSLLFLFLSAALIGCTKETKNETRTGLVETKTLIQKVSLNGRLRGLRESEIKPGYSGYVGKIYVKVGQKVKEGAPLVRVVQTVNQPFSEVFPILAPFTGTVTQILSREGEYVTTANSTILVVNDLKEVWVDAAIPEVDIAKVAVGQDAEVRANALSQEKYKGVVQTIALSPKKSDNWRDRGRVEYPTDIKIKNPDDNLRPGMTVVVDVISAKVENIPAIRHEFIHRDDKGYFLLGKDDTRYNVKTGLSNESYVEITEGAKEGLEVKMVDFSKL